MDIKAIIERKAVAKQALEYMQMTNIYNKKPEEIAEIDIAVAKAQIEYDKALKAYQDYIDSEASKEA